MYVYIRQQWMVDGDSDLNNKRHPTDTNTPPPFPRTTHTKTAGRVSDAFRSAHGLLVVHVWMLHKRLLMEVGESGV